MTLGLFARVAAGLSAAMLLLSACVVEEGPGYSPPRYDPPRFEEPRGCIREYAPVCGERGRDRQTFGNACVARSEGFRIVGQGECRRDGGSPIQACTREYAPVCAERRGDRRTFGNSCMAGEQGYRVVRSGECGRGGNDRRDVERDRRDRERERRPDDRRAGRDDRPGGVAGAGERACTREYAPVCGRRGGQTRTFGNQCEADAASFRVVRQGAC